MSIWASVEGEEVRGIEIGAPGVDTYGGTGPGGVAIEVATATSWNKQIRLGVYSDWTDVNLEVMITPEAATKLRDQLMVAIHRITQLTNTP
jgi:hypothetical protein